MTMNVSLNRRSTVDSSHEAHAEGAQRATAQPAVQRSGTAATTRENLVTPGAAPSTQATRLQQASGSRQCTTTPALSTRASEGQIEEYRVALSAGRTPAAPPAPPPMPTIRGQQAFQALLRNLPADHPLRAALGQVAWQDSNRPPISDFIHHTLVHLLPEGVARDIAHHVAGMLYPDFTSGSAGGHAAHHLTQETIVHAIAHALKEAGREVAQHVVEGAAQYLGIALQMADSAIIMAREASRLARGERIPTAAIVDAQQAQEITRARTQFDDGARAALHGDVDCNRLSRDRVYAQGVEAGTQYRRQHGETYAARARHDEAMTIAQQRSLRSPTADMRMLRAGEALNPGDVQSAAIDRALAE